MSTHQAVEWVEHDRHECRVCGEPVVGFGPTLRHRGEADRHALPIDPDDLRMYDRAVRQATRALDERTQMDVPDEEAARLVVSALFADGLLRRRRDPKRALTTA